MNYFFLFPSQITDILEPSENDHSVTSNDHIYNQHIKYKMIEKSNGMFATKKNYRKHEN